MHYGSWPPVFFTLDTATKHSAHHQSKSLSFHRNSFLLYAAKHAAQHFMLVLAWTMRWNKGAWCGRELASSSGSRYGPPDPSDALYRHVRWERGKLYYISLEHINNYAFN